MSNYSSMDGVLYCKPHFEQLFKESGNFSKNFQSGNITKTLFSLHNLHGCSCVAWSLTDIIYMCVVFMAMYNLAAKTEKKEDQLVQFSFLSIYPSLSYFSLYFSINGNKRKFNKWCSLGPLANSLPCSVEPKTNALPAEKQFIPWRRLVSSQPWFYIIL